MSNVESRAAGQTVRQASSNAAASATASRPAPAFPAGLWGGDPALARTIERELVPRMLLAHRVGPFPPLGVGTVAPGPGVVSSDDLHRFADHVLAEDDDAVAGCIDELMADGATLEVVCLDLLAPTARHLGHLWASDERDFFEVTVGLGRVHRAMREAVHRAPTPSVPPVPTGRALVTALPGEQHTLGLAMVAEFFVRDGWGVQLGAPASEEELSSLVRAGWLDVVGFSVASEDRLLTLRRVIATARRHSQNPHLVVLVGGRVFSEHPELAERVGADGYADTAVDAPVRARELVRQTPR